MLYEVLHRNFISTPTAMCHASTVLPLTDGTVLAAWFGGSHEGEPDTAIWYAVCRGGSWSEPTALTHLDEPHWNPVLRQDDAGIVHLYYKIGARIAEWRTMVCTSADGGRVWSLPRELVPGDNSGGRGPVRNKILRLADGRLLAPASTEHGLWLAFVDISDDNGVTWTKSATTAIANLTYSQGERTTKGSAIAVSEQSFYGRGVIQPSLWESAPGAVHMLLRSSEGAVYRSDSTDRGDTWCPAYSTSLPNNNSCLDLAKVLAPVQTPAEPDALVLACNPVDENWGLRTPMTLFLSRNNGESWHKLTDLDAGTGEFAYPAVVAQGEHIHVTYTWKRTSIAYWNLSIVLNETERGAQSHD